MVEVPASVIDELRAAQDAAAREFWAYPDEDWQRQFQSTWLTARGLPETVACDGLVWGE